MPARPRPLHTLQRHSLVWLTYGLRRVQLGPVLVISHLTRTRLRRVRPVGQSRELPTQIPPDPTMQGRPMHPHSCGDLNHSSPCQHSPDRVQALLDNRQNNQCQSRPP